MAVYLDWWKTVQNQSDLIWFIPSEFESVRTKFSIRIIPTADTFGFKIRFRSIGARIDLDSGGLMPRIKAESIGLSGLIFVSFIFLAKDSDWYLIRGNQSFFELCRNMIPNHSESFRTNSKNVVYLDWWKTVQNQSDLIRFIPSEFEWVRTKFSIRIIPTSDTFGLKIRFRSIGARIDLDSGGLMPRIEAESIGLSGLILDRFWSNRIKNVILVQVGN